MLTTKFRRIKFQLSLNGQICFFPGNIVILDCVSAIADFDVLCILWIFTVEWRLLICTNNMCKKHRWKGDILSKDVSH